MASSGLLDRLLSARLALLLNLRKIQRLLRFEDRERIIAGDRDHALLVRDGLALASIPELHPLGGKLGHRLALLFQLLGALGDVFAEHRAGRLRGFPLQLLPPPRLLVEFFRSSAPAPSCIPSATSRRKPA
jgi:hypothetical protein